jgi:hypothetical protein
MHNGPSGMYTQLTEAAIDDGAAASGRRQCHRSGQRALQPRTMRPVIMSTNSEKSTLPDSSLSMSAIMRRTSAFLTCAGGAGEMGCRRQGRHTDSGVTPIKTKMQAASGSQSALSQADDSGDHRRGASMRRPRGEEIPRRTREAHDMTQRDGAATSTSQVRVVKVGLRTCGVCVREVDDRPVPACRSRRGGSSVHACHRTWQIARSQALVSHCRHPLKVHTMDRCG